MKVLNQGQRAFTVKKDGADFVLLPRKVVDLPEVQARSMAKAYREITILDEIGQEVEETKKQKSKKVKPEIDETEEDKTEE